MTPLDDVAGIFQAGAEGSVRNNGTEEVTVTVLEITADTTARAAPTDEAEQQKCWTRVGMHLIPHPR
jgi:hypothetical protein